MIIEFKVKNFRSIKDEQVLSFEASKDKEYEDYYVTKIGKYRLLKMAMIYGANASGKSNVLDALHLLRILAIGRRDSDARIYTEPFKFCKSTGKSNTELTLIFFAKKDEEYVKYKYQLIVNKKSIIEEKLEYYPSIQPALVFHRRQNLENERGFDLKIPTTLQLKISDREVIEANTLHNTSIVSVLKKVNPLFPALKTAYAYLKDNLNPIINENSSIRTYSTDFFLDNKDQKELLLSFLQKADFNISDIVIEAIEEDVPAEFLEFLKQQVENKEKLPSKMSTYKRTLIHEIENDLVENVETSLDFDEESLGTQKMFDLAGPFLEAIKKDRILYIDELESSLHFELQKYLILVFLHNAKDTQFFFTTHNLMLLDWDEVRNDTVFFTDKRRDGSTELYSLADFKGTKRSKVLKKYMAGNYGATPDIYDFYIDGLCKG